MLDRNGDTQKEYGNLSEFDERRMEFFKWKHEEQKMLEDKKGRKKKCCKCVLI